MGTYIHKVLGYGVKSIEGDRERIWDIFENSHNGEVAEFVNAAAMEAREEKRHGYVSLSFEMFRPDLKTPYPPQFHDVIRYADHPDSGNGWWVILPPLQWKQWFRMDSSLDYYECYDETSDDPLETVVKELNIPLYPYLMWMDRTTGAVLQEYSPIRDGRNPDIVPFVPEVVQLIAKRFGFPDWKLFRPVLTRWWC